MLILLAPTTEARPDNYASKKRCPTIGAHCAHAPINPKDAPQVVCERKQAKPNYTSPNKEFSGRVI